MWEGFPTEETPPSSPCPQAKAATPSLTAAWAGLPSSHLAWWPTAPTGSGHRCHPHFTNSKTRPKEGNTGPKAPKDLSPGLCHSRLYFPTHQPYCLPGDPGNHSTSGLPCRQSKGSPAFSRISAGGRIWIRASSPPLSSQGTWDKLSDLTLASVSLAVKWGSQSPAHSPLMKME